jgi:SAM-dependent methyltransferase
MSGPSLRDIVAQLSSSATALSVLAAEMQARVEGRAVHESVKPHARAVLEQAGAAAALDAAEPADIAALLAEVQHFWMIDDDFLRRPEREPGWTYDDIDILRTGGLITRGFADVLPKVAQGLDGLAERLASKDGRFLDIGTGVGSLSVAVAERFPALRVVGIDAWAPALALARDNVARAGLTDRIELREQRGEELPDEGAFDLAWVPAPFIPPAALPRLLERVHRALKPGAWLLLATTRPGDDLRGAIMRMRVALFGGRPMAEEEVKALLASFADVRVLPGPPKDFKMVVAARKA